MRTKKANGHNGLVKPSQHLIRREATLLSKALFFRLITLANRWEAEDRTKDSLCLAPRGGGGKKKKNLSSEIHKSVGCFKTGKIKKSASDLLRKFWAGASVEDNGSKIFLGAANDPNA